MQLKPGLICTAMMAMLSAQAVAQDEYYDYGFVGGSLALGNPFFLKTVQVRSLNPTFFITANTVLLTEGC